jgi:hypothetical protein
MKPLCFISSVVAQQKSCMSPSFILNCLYMLLNKGDHTRYFCKNSLCLIVCSVKCTMLLPQQQLYYSLCYIIMCLDLRVVKTHPHKLAPPHPCTPTPLKICNPAPPHHCTPATTQHYASITALVLLILINSRKQHRRYYILYL